MPPHACLLRSLGRHAFRVAPAPPVDHAHRPLHCKVSITRHVSFLWSGRVHGPHPFIIAERPSQLKPNAAMFHDASRECPPARSPNLKPNRHRRRWGFRRNRKYLHKRCSVPAIRGDHIYTKAAQAATRSGRDKMNPTPSVGEARGNGPSITERTLRRVARSSIRSSARFLELFR